MSKKIMGFLDQSSHAIQPTTLVPPTFTHAICLGETGSGKTTGFILPNLKERIKLDHGIIVYDFKGTLHRYIKVLAKQEGRLSDIVEIGVPWGKKINPLDNLTLYECENFLNTLISSDDKDGAFWHTAASSLGRLVIDLLRRGNALKEGFLDLCAHAHPELTEDMAAQIEHKFKSEIYFRQVSFETLHHCVKDVDSLSSAIRTMKKLRSYIDMFTQALIKNHHHNGIMLSIDPDDLVDDTSMASYNVLIIEKLEETLTNLSMLDEKINLLKSYEDLSPDKNDFSGSYGVLFSLSTHTSKLADNIFMKSFENNYVDIAHLVNQRKIVIITATSFPSYVINVMNEAIVKTLSKRTKISRKTPVTIFMDEAYRIIDEHTDLGVDILREAQVDVIMAVQNESQLITKLGKDKYLQLKGNLAKQIYYRNNVHMQQVDTHEDIENFKNHRYYDTSTKSCYDGDPLYISENEMNTTELLWQTSHCQKQFMEGLSHKNYSKLSQSTILIYDEILFDRSQSIWLYDFECDTYEEIPFKDTVVAKRVLNEFKTYFSRPIKEMEYSFDKYKNEFLAENDEMSDDEPF